MTLIATISKLPQDLIDVHHILPIWFKYLYMFMWGLGAFLVLSLLINFLVKLVRHLREIESARTNVQKKIQGMSEAELKIELAKLLQDVDTTKNFRSGLHRVSSLLKTYFEIRLKKEIEEMTASEILTQVKERKDLGTFFIELQVAQFKSQDPDMREFLEQYNRTVEIVKKA